MCSFRSAWNELSWVVVVVAASNHADEDKKASSERTRSSSRQWKQNNEENYEIFKMRESAYIISYSNLLYEPAHNINTTQENEAYIYQCCIEYKYMCTIRCKQAYLLFLAYEFKEEKSIYILMKCLFRNQIAIDSKRSLHYIPIYTCNKWNK